MKSPRPGLPLRSSAFESHGPRASLETADGSGKDFLWARRPGCGFPAHAARWRAALPHRTASAGSWPGGMHRKASPLTAPSPFPSLHSSEAEVVGPHASAQLREGCVSPQHHSALRAAPARTPSSLTRGSGGAHGAFSQPALEGAPALPGRQAHVARGPTQPGLRPRSPGELEPASACVADGSAAPRNPPEGLRKPRPRPEVPRGARTGSVHPSGGLSPPPPQSFPKSAPVSWSVRGHLPGGLAHALPRSGVPRQTAGRKQRQRVRPQDHEDPRERGLHAAAPGKPSPCNAALRGSATPAPVTGDRLSRVPPARPVLSPGLGRISAPPAESAPLRVPRRLWGPRRLGHHGWNTPPGAARPLCRRAHGPTGLCDIT